jgi:hypothetical protein
LRRVQAGVYETEDGLFRVEKDTFFTEYEDHYLERHPEINVTGNKGMRAYDAWQVWNVERDDYVPGGEEFSSKKEAVSFLERYLNDR